MNAFDRVKGMDRIFCGLYLLLGYGFIWMFTDSTSAWCLPVYTVFYAAVVLLYARTLEIRPVKESWFWFVILLVLGISQEIDNGMMVGRFLALLLVAAYWTFAVSGRLLDQGRTSGWILFDGWNALGMVPFTNMDDLIRVLFHQKSGDGEQDKTSLPEMKAVALGFGIAAVLLCILLPLLSGADAGFEMLTGDVADWITAHLLGFALRMCFAIPVILSVWSDFWRTDWTAYRLYQGRYAEKDKKPDSDPAGTGSGHNFCANLWCVYIIYRTAGVIPVLGTGWKAAGGIYLCRICQKGIF